MKKLEESLLDIRRGSSLESRDMVKGEKTLEPGEEFGRSPENKFKRIGLYQSTANQRSKLNLKELA